MFPELYPEKAVLVLKPKVEVAYFLIFLTATSFSVSLVEARIFSPLFIVGLADAVFDRTVVFVLVSFSLIYFLIFLAATSFSVSLVEARILSPLFIVGLADA